MKAMTFEDHLSIAAARVADHIADSVPDDDGCNHVFSERFEHNMQEFIDNWGAKKKHPVVRRILLIAAAILLAFGILMAGNSEVRAAVTGWFKELYCNFTVFRYHGYSEPEVPDSWELPKYELTWVPEEYELKDRIEHTYFALDVYVNSEQEMLTLEYLYGDDGGAAFIDTQKAKMEKVLVGDTEAEFYRQEGIASNTLVWQDQEGFLFIVDGFEDLDTLIRIAENVQLKE